MRRLLPDEPRLQPGDPETLRGAGARVRRALAAGRRLAALHRATLPEGTTLAEAIASLRRRTHADRTGAGATTPRRVSSAGR